MHAAPDARTALLRGDVDALRVKVCCIASPDEADVAIDAGADALGLVSAMPSGPGPIPESEIAAIVRHVGPRAATVLLTSRQTAAGIGKQVERISPAVVQIVDDLPLADYAVLRATHPSVAIMQVIHVTGPTSVGDALRVAPFVDAILLDSGNPTATLKELGGTGRVHDWTVSRAIRDAASVPVFLAGGLRSSNVAEAVDMVRPFGVDVCSGVRASGMLDSAGVRAFIQAARKSGGRA